MIIIKIKNLKEQKTLTNINIEHNIKFLMSRQWGDDIVKPDKSVAHDIYEDQDYDTDEIEEELLPTLISNMPPLKNNKITSAIFGASFGKIFKLSNGHILKIFKNGINPEDDFQWYKENHDKMFAGSADINTLPIYDIGKADRGDFIELYYVEMAELIPLDNWLLKTKRITSGNFDPIDTIKYAYRLVQTEYEQWKEDSREDQELKKLNKKSPNKMTPEEYADAALEIANRKNMKYSPFTENEFKAIVVAAVKFERSGRALSDFAARNMGIIPTSNPSNPVVIIFDK